MTAHQLHEIAFALALVAGVVREDDRALCDEALALANRGELADTVAKPGDAADGDTERWQNGGERYGTVSGAYSIRLGADAVRLLQLSVGGSCASTALAREDGTELV